MSSKSLSHASKSLSYAPRVDELTPEQVEETKRILDVVSGAMRVEVEALVRLLVSKDNQNFFGATEFLMRERLLGMGVRMLESALAERKKRGIKVPA